MTTVAAPIYLAANVRSIYTNRKSMYLLSLILLSSEVDTKTLKYIMPYFRSIRRSVAKGISMTGIHNGAVYILIIFYTLTVDDARVSLWWKYSL